MGSTASWDDPSRRILRAPAWPEENRTMHVALHKPVGYSCSHNRVESPVVDELLPETLQERGLEPIGRLDRATSGLLILTTDGQSIHALGHADHKVEKQYRIGFRGLLPASVIDRFAEGIRVPGYATPTRPADLVIVRPCRFRGTELDEKLGEATLVLREGRNRQVRRMFRAVRANVVTLHRERIGGYWLPPALLPGEFCRLTASDRAALHEGSPPSPDRPPPHLEGA